MPATVTIRREILDVEVHGTEADGVAVQRRLSDVCADVLEPALEAAFARVDPGDAHLMIERLAIDLADISLDRLDAELTDAVHGRSRTTSAATRCGPAQGRLRRPATCSGALWPRPWTRRYSCFFAQVGCR